MRDPYTSRTLSRCPVCGKPYVPYWERGTCSMECYLARPFPRHPYITPDDIERVKRMYPTQREAAEALGVGLKQYRRVTRGAA